MKLVLCGDVAQLSAHSTSVRGPTIESYSGWTTCPNDEDRKGSPPWTKPRHRHPTSISRTRSSPAPRLPSIRGPGPRKRQRLRRGQTFLKRADPTARSVALLEMTRFTSRARPRPSRRIGACSRRPASWALRVPRKRGPRPLACGAPRTVRRGCADPVSIDQEGADTSAGAIASSDAAPSGITLPSGYFAHGEHHYVVIVSGEMVRSSQRPRRSRTNWPAQGRGSSAISGEHATVRLHPPASRPPTQPLDWPVAGRGRRRLAERGHAADCAV
jgi:hypothetical protein